MLIVTAVFMVMLCIWIEFYGDKVKSPGAGCTIILLALLLSLIFGMAISYILPIPENEVNEYRMEPIFNNNSEVYLFNGNYCRNEPFYMYAYNSCPRDPYCIDFKILLNSGGVVITKKENTEPTVIITTHKQLNPLLYNIFIKKSYEFVLDDKNIEKR